MSNRFPLLKEMDTEYLPEFQGAYLEDSYFLGMIVEGCDFRLKMLFALTMDHPSYKPPKPGEEHCFREGSLLVRRPTSIDVKPTIKPNPVPGTLILHPDKEMDEIASIVKDSVARNAEIGVTGALIYTGAHFIQALEGEFEPIDQLMKSIKADVRHRQVRVIQQDRVRERRFASWHMAYRRLNADVDRAVREVTVANDYAGSAVQRVYEVMAKFART